MRTALALLAVCLLANSVDAGLIIDFEEAGGNVTATLSGSLTIGGSRNGRGQLDAEDIAPGFGVIDFGGGRDFESTFTTAP